MEEGVGRRSDWGIDVHVGDGVYLGIKSTMGKSSHMNCPEEDSERITGNEATLR